ncbi:MAG: M55 family metallopeptidase [Armatimonadetes bacterium]|nr:M55 family metallopeptidase [Armatimonadota bacterium]
MRAFILCDYEGATGVVSWGDEENTLGPEAMAGDVNATIDGLRQGGFTKFVVRDYHSEGRTIHPASIDPAATLIRGKSTPYPYGLSTDFDAMCFVGAHSMAGTQTGVMCHTMNGEVHAVHINGKQIGEIGGFAYLTSHFGVPLIFVTGDKAACDEALDICGDVEVAPTKFGLSRNCGEMLHPSVSRKGITEAAARAAKRVKEFKLLTTELPCTLDVTYHTPNLADRVFDTGGGQRIDGCTVRVVADTIFDAFKRFERGFQ